MSRFALIVLVLTPTAFASSERVVAVEPPPAVATFVAKHCVDCHSGDAAEAGFRIDRLGDVGSEADEFEAWVAVHDRVKSGEMPPPEAEQPTAEERAAMLKPLADRLRAVDSARIAEEGRTKLRRLNRAEYEATLRDLLALPQLDVAGMLPVDQSAQGFDNVGAALSVSHIQMARYLEAANHAIDEAMALGERPKPMQLKLVARENGRFSQVLRKGQEAVPVGDAVGLLRQPNTAQAPWWWSKFRPEAAGTYRLRMKTLGFLWNEGEVDPPGRPHVVSFDALWGTTKRRLGRFDVDGTPESPGIIEFTAYIEPGDQIQIWFNSLDDRNKGKTPLEEYTAPGVAVEWLEIEGPLIEEWPPASRTALFGDLPVEPWTPETGLVEPPLPMVVSGEGKRAEWQQAKRNKITLWHVVSENPEADARRLLRDFAERAFRRPVDAAEIADALALVKSKLEAKLTFQEAMRIGFQSILCSPEFLFLLETPGRLDDHALASRLSYFLWSSQPDETLLNLAEDGTLSDPDVLRRQVERMLDDPRSERFVENFTGQWLDLRRITVTEPDDTLYPEFDRLLLESMIEETRAYFREMLREDLGVAHVMDSDFAMLNGRLADLYDVPGVEGVAIRRVPLPAESVRGGLLTQASILKVTANGTTTSPVTRGAWVLERFLGQPAPPPPANVPAIEPDLRGTTTIREQLAKHREDAACARCHVRIDPPGFALESFDVIGGHRDRYRSLGEGDRVKPKREGDRPVRYKLGPPVDPSGHTPDGRPFADVEEFRTLLLRDPEPLAHSLTEKLLVYATGAGVGFADRPVIAEILARSRAKDHGLRTLIHEIVRSDTFQSK